MARRAVLAGVLAGAGWLSGCAPPSSPGSPSSAAATDPADSATPEVIVTLDPFSTYNLLDLGLLPAGVQDGLSDVVNPRYADQYAQIPKAGTYFEPQLEVIAALGPDLILASTGQAELEDKLTQIARTVLVAGTTSSTWRQAANEVAAAVGRVEAMNALERAYLTRAEEIENRHAERLAGLTWAMIWQGTAEGFSVRSPLSNGGQVLARAGAQYCAVATSAAGDSDTQLSWEQVDEIADADVICVPGSTNGRPNAGTELIRSAKTFATLAAVKAGRVIEFDYMLPGSYLNAGQLLDELDTALGQLS